MDGGAWKAIVHGVAKSRTRLNDLTFTFSALERDPALRVDRCLLNECVAGDLVK